MKYRDFMTQKEREYFEELWKMKREKGLRFMADYAGINLDFLVHELRVFEINVPNIMVIHARKLKVRETV